MLKELRVESNEWITAVAEYAVVSTGLLVSENIRDMFMGIEMSKRKRGNIRIHVVKNNEIRDEFVPSTFGFMNTVRFIGTMASDCGTVVVDCLDGDGRIIKEISFFLG